MDEDQLNFGINIFIPENKVPSTFKKHFEDLIKRNEDIIRISRLFDKYEIRRKYGIHLGNIFYRLYEYIEYPARLDNIYLSELSNIYENYEEGINNLKDDFLINLSNNEDVNSTLKSTIENKDDRKKPKKSRFSPITGVVQPMIVPWPTLTNTQPPVYGNAPIAYTNAPIGLNLPNIQRLPVLSPIYSGVRSLPTIISSNNISTYVSEPIKPISIIKPSLEVILATGPKEPYIYDDMIIINRKIFIYDKDEVASQLDALKSDLKNIFDTIIQEYSNLHIHIDFKYSIFLNKDNPNVWAFINNAKITPGTFKLFKINDNTENAEYFNRLKDNFFYKGGWDQSSNIYSEQEYHQNNPHPQPIEDPLDPGFRRYSGWNKTEVVKAITDSGLFDFQKMKFGRFDCYSFPKLNELGIKNPTASRLEVKDIYFKYMPRYALETLYAKVTDTTVKWDEIFAGNFPIEAIRKLAKDELGVVIHGDLNELKVRINSIIRNKELGLELPDLREQFIFSPEYVNTPKVQYKKYMMSSQGFKIKPDVVDIEKYLAEISNVCLDNSKTTLDVREIAVNIGIEKYLKDDMSKPQMCQIIQNYLNIIRNERIL
jgi:hypothetical protein